MPNKINAKLFGYQTETSLIFFSKYLWKISTPVICIDKMYFHEY
jgi:hypothetical protein